LTFLEHPANVTATPGGSARLRCRVRMRGGAGPEPGHAPELGWARDGDPAELGDSDMAQVALPGGGWAATSQLRIFPLTASDSGRYRCWARVGGGAQ
ncbi:UFO kinase, partial [Origma solitaria]|nr:UFO kinase [Origma solitaria]